MTPRGRPRKHRWFSLDELSSDFSLDAQYLKWASSNNLAIQSVVATGCPKCHSDNFELRLDRKYKIVRLHCIGCLHETSFRVKTPKPGTFKIEPVFENGIQIGEKVVDRYHPLTQRQRTDILVMKTMQDVESGRISLGGEWDVDVVTGSLHGQKRCCLSFEEATRICNRNNMRIEHEQRLHKLEGASVLQLLEV